MTKLHPAVAGTRLAVRRALTEAKILQNTLVFVACSGGYDSLALAAAVAFEIAKFGLHAGSITVDHGLQDGSDVVARCAAAHCHRLGLAPVEIERAVTEHGSTNGPEAQAREARYVVLRAIASRNNAACVLLGHTRDDQAETVLLGLARGSGGRAIAGMRPDATITGHAEIADAAGNVVCHPAETRLLRPFLDITRAETRAACAALGIEPWDDPHNNDPRYLRVRMRRALSDLEHDIGPGVIAGLARTATLSRQDSDELDAQARLAAYEIGENPWHVSELSTLAPAIRTRVWRILLADSGARGRDVFKIHVDTVDALITRWRGQRSINVPGGVRVRRVDGLIHVETRQS